MKRNYYIFSSGKFARKHNTLYFQPGEQSEPEEDTEEDVLEIEDDAIDEEDNEHNEPKPMPAKPIPVEDIESIYAFSQLRFNTQFLNFLAKHQITLHLFNYYGYYTGSFYPRDPYISGKLLVRQVTAYTTPDVRTATARKFVDGAAQNIKKNLQYYNARGKDMSPFIPKIDELMNKIDSAGDVEELMGIEGNIRSTYYTTWHLIIDEPIDFNKRQKRPPNNPLNALISFGNSLVYTSVLSEIYKTQLNPLISYLHEPGERRFSLALDLAEIFKPLLSDRLIFSLLNKKQLQEKHFDKNLNYCYLNEQGRKIYLKEFDAKLKTTIKHRQLKKSVSYRHLIRLECYKLIKHILGEKEYQPFKIWW